MGYKEGVTAVTPIAEHIGMAIQKAKSRARIPYTELPMRKDRRGRTIYLWDAWFTGCSDDPNSQKVQDVWELACRLDEQRRQAEMNNARRENGRVTTLAKVEIEEKQKKRSGNRQGKWKRD